MEIWGEDRLKKIHFYSFMRSLILDLDSCYELLNAIAKSVIDFVT